MIKYAAEPEIELRKKSQLDSNYSIIPDQTYQFCVINYFIEWSKVLNEIISVVMLGQKLDFII